MKKLEVVSFGVAKKLKELGFDWPCSVMYDLEGVEVHRSYLEDGFWAPEKELAVQWLISKGYWCGVFPQTKSSDGSVWWTYRYIDVNSKVKVTSYAGIWHDRDDCMEHMIGVLLAKMTEDVGVL